MVVSEGAINNIMGGMENTAGVRLHSHRHKLKQRFDIIRKLGQGTYGKVQLAVNKESGQEVAIKTIKKAKIETEQDLIRIRREIQIMSSVQHPHIIHIYEVFENREKMVLVMEYAAGGELYDYLSERKVLKEDEARRVFRQVASAAYYCHKHKICHRDLKLENILLDIEGNAKIADFGLSNVFAESHRLDTFCGSPLYASPEIVKGTPYIGPEVDCWSLGVLLYTLVYGAMPFDGSNFRRLVKQITQGDFYEPETPSPASDLIRHMLAVKADERANVEDICSHWWVNKGYQSCLEEAETLANQTPVRLDLLLSLAPKHINSEHMLIQPEDEDSQRSESSRMTNNRDAVPNSSVDTPSTESMATRSLSMGAMPPPASNHSEMNEIDQLLEKKREERRKSEDKKRQIEDASIVESKKKKEDTPSLKEDDVKSRTDSDRKKSTRDSTDRDRKKSVKKKEGSVEKDMSTSEKEKKKTVKKRDSSASREAKEKKKTSKKKEEVPKAVEDPPFFSVTSPKHYSTSPSQSENAVIDVEPVVEPVIRRSLSPTTSTDATLKASDSSVSRISDSPSKDISEPVSTSSHLSVKKERKTKGVKDPGSKENIKNDSSKDIPKDVSMVSVKSEEFSKVKKDPTKPSLTKPSPTPSKKDISVDNLSDIDTDKILQETAEKIERVEAAMKEESQNRKIEKPTKLALTNKKFEKQDSVKSSPTSPMAEKPFKESTTRDSSVNASSIGSSQGSQGTTPDRSRTGSESSSENRPSRSENASRRQSKIFSKAAMFDQMLCGNNSVSPPDKPKKITRPGGLNMSDLAKKFEEKTPVEKKKVISTFKTSDVRSRFESDKSESSSPMRKASAGSSGESMPTSPSRTDKSILTNANATSPKTSTVGLPSSIKPKPATPTEELPLSKKENVTAIKSTRAISPTKNEKSSAVVSKPIKEKSPLKDKENSRPVVPKRGISPKKEDRPKPYQPKIITKMEAKVTTITPKIESKVAKPDPAKVSNAAAAKAAALRRVALASEAVTSDSSDSESEAERVLKFLAQKREKLEQAKVEKLRLNSEAAKNRQAALEKTASKDEAKKVYPPKAKLNENATEMNDATKFATLPKGFKTKPDPISRPSADEASVYEEEEEPLPDQLSVGTAKKSLIPEAIPTQRLCQTIGEKKRDFPIQIKRVVKEVVPIPPETVLAPTPRTPEMTPNAKRFGMKGRSVSADEPTVVEGGRKKTEMAIVLNNQSASSSQVNKPDPRRSSYTEIKIASPVTKTKPEFKTEVRHSVSAAEPLTQMARSSPAPTFTKSESQQTFSESQLQRARRERIIPIMLEEEEEEVDKRSDVRAASSVASPIVTFPSRNSSLSSVTSGPPSRVGNFASQPQPAGFNKNVIGNGATASPENIRKSKRERIIPISVEGEGYISPIPSESNFSKYQTQSTFGRNKPYGLEQSESFSSAGEDDDDEEDDAFQILTAESLFSTLLSRVRSLTRKMTAEEGRGGRRIPLHPQANMPGGPGGFWSSFNNAPGDSPARRISDNLSRSSLSRDEEPVGFGGLWSRTSSRDHSDAESVFSDPSSPFNTMPRGGFLRHSFHMQPSLLNDPFFTRT